MPSAELAAKAALEAKSERACVQAKGQHVRGRCQYSLSTVVCSAIFVGMLLASLGTCIPLFMLQLSNSNDLLNFVNHVATVDGALIDNLVYDNMTKTTYRTLLTSIGLMVVKSVTTPTDYALDSLWTAMQAQHSLDVSWNGRDGAQRDFMNALTFQVVSSQENKESDLLLQWGSSVIIQKKD
jgi:hypothetical protein